MSGGRELLLIEELCVLTDLGTAGESVQRTKLVRFIRKHATGVAPTELHTVQVERGMIWQEAIDKWVLFCFSCTTW